MLHWLSWRSLQHADLSRAPSESTPKHSLVMKTSDVGPGDSKRSLQLAPPKSSKLR